MEEVLFGRRSESMSGREGQSENKENVESTITTTTTIIRGNEVKE